MSGTGAAGASYGDLLVTSLVVLGGVCVAALVVVRLLGRVLATGRSHGGHLLDVIARLPLEPRRSLYIVEVAGKTLLVGTSEMGLSLLSELDASEVRARVVARPSFGDLVRQAWPKRRTASSPPLEHADPPTAAAMDAPMVRDAARQPSTTGAPATGSRPANDEAR
jgi:flagellar protein FliO/FliZ